MEINRDSYLERLGHFMHNGTVKVVTGVRRCGKSYLLRTLFHRYLINNGVPEDHIVEIDLEAEGNERYWDPLVLGEYIRSRINGNGRYYVILDEIQRVRKTLPPGVDLARIDPEEQESAYVTFYDVLNGLNNRNNVDVYVTGSNSKMLSKDVMTVFRGRSTEIRVFPLSFSEVLSAKGGDKSDVWEEYLMFGGMPQAVLEPDEKERANILKSLFEYVYFRDLVERHSLKNDMVLREITDVVCSSVGSLVSPQKIEATILSVQGHSASAPTVKKYLEYLEDAFLFEKASRYDVRGRKYFDTPAKYFAADAGLRNARLNFREPERTHLMENVIYNELRRRGYSVDVGVVDIQSTVDGKRVFKRHEIDFVVNLPLGKMYIQSAFNIDDPVRKAAETASLHKTGDFFRKLIVTDGNRKLVTDEDGISYVGVLQFLTNSDIMN